MKPHNRATLIKLIYAICYTNFFFIITYVAVFLVTKWPIAAMICSIISGTLATKDWENHERRAERNSTPMR